jgi:hypothetical protein
MREHDAARVTGRSRRVLQEAQVLGARDVIGGRRAVVLELVGLEDQPDVRRQGDAGVDALAEPADGGDESRKMFAVASTPRVG